MEKEDYDGEEWRLGYIAFRINTINDSKVDIEFYNYKKGTFVIGMEIPYEELKKMITNTEKEIKVGSVYKFNTLAVGLDLDELVLRISYLISYFGACYDRTRYLVGDTSYNYNNGGQLFCTSVVISMLNYIRFIALKNNKKEDFDQVLDVLAENIKINNEHEAIL